MDQQIRKLDPLIGADVQHLPEQENIVRLVANFFRACKTIFWKLPVSAKHWMTYSQMQICIKNWQIHQYGHLVRDIGTKVNREGQIGIDGFNQVAQFFAAFQLKISLLIFNLFWQVLKYKMVLMRFPTENKFEKHIPTLF